MTRARRLPDGTAVTLNDAWTACAEPGCFGECEDQRPMVGRPARVLQSIRRWWLFGEITYILVVDTDLPNDIAYASRDEFDLVPPPEPRGDRRALDLPVRLLALNPSERVEIVRAATLLGDISHRVLDGTPLVIDANGFVGILDVDPYMNTVGPGCDWGRQS